MKSLVVGAMICAATVGTSMAATYVPSSSIKENVTEKPIDQPSIDAFKEQIAFHQKNVDVLWSQYALAEARIREARGSHADLENEKAFFTNVYRQDIANGVRVEASRMAIAEIEADYVKKHTARDALESRKITRLQSQLMAELKRERKSFKSSKRKHERLVNEQTQPLLSEVEHHFAKSIERASKLGSGGDTTTVAGL